MRKHESDYRKKKEQNYKSNYLGGLNKSRLLIAVISFFIGIYLLYEYFFGG